MRIQNRMAKTAKCKMLPMVHLCMSPKATGKIFLTIIRMHMYFLLCLLGSENYKLRVYCAVLTQSNVMGTPKLGKSLKTFLLCFFI